MLMANSVAAASGRSVLRADVSIHLIVISIAAAGGGAMLRRRYMYSVLTRWYWSGGDGQRNVLIAKAF